MKKRSLFGGKNVNAGKRNLDIDKILSRIVDKDDLYSISSNISAEWIEEMFMHKGYERNRNKGSKLKTPFSVHRLRPRYALRFPFAVLQLMFDNLYIINQFKFVIFCTLQYFLSLDLVEGLVE
ncbi:hypothetical protein L1987_04029 [Smallanthus sonchifolius]|uniref:Uncharacterized protein n=1 Tax=Smallanthus sonchifolius TaxID=185202 RepID=A0ACB9KCE1_9ASTR|nr:hypothetical protein L1987_04029 [Smallanthus sonchifolius]